MGSRRGSLVPLRDALRDLLAWFRAEHVPGLVIGGVAASLLGRPRVTRDVDALVLLDRSRYEDFLAGGLDFGFAPRISGAVDFARKNAVLLVRHEPSGVDADIAFGDLPFEKEAVARRIRVNLAGLQVPVPAPEDLVIMKAVARRARDIADIESLLDLTPALDLRRVRRWLREFSSATGMPEILADFEAILARRRRRRK